MTKVPIDYVYPSKVDAWVAAMIAISPLMSFVLAFVFWQRGQPGDALTLLLVGLSVFLFTILLVYPCKYTLSAEQLSIRAGLFRYRVAYKDIVSVQKSSSLRSGPALSMHRLLITTNRRSHLISPIHREEFIEKLQDKIMEADQSSATSME